MFIGRTDAEAETPILWPSGAMSQLLRKDPDAGKDWGQEEKGQQRMRRLDGITDLMGMSVSKLREIVKDVQRVRHNLATEQQQQSIWLGFPGSSVVKNPSANAGEAGSIPGSERSPEKEMATHSSSLA